MFQFVICLLFTFVWRMFKSILYTLRNDVRETPFVFFSSTERNRYLVEQMTSIKSFEPVCFGTDGLTQTVLVELLYRYSHSFKRGGAVIQELVAMDDGQTIALDWLNIDVKEPRAVVILLPGIGGKTYSCYNAPWFEICKQQDYIGVVVNRRGFLKNNTMNRGAVRFPTHADVEDTVAILTHIQMRYPGLPRFGLGYSAGGNHLIKSVGSLDSSRQKKLLTACVSISCNNDIIKTHEFLVANKTFDCILSMSISDILKNNIHLPFRREALSTPSLTHIDRCIAHQVGFPNVETYYRDCSSIDELCNMQIPTLIMFSEDDPLLDGMKELAMGACVENSNLISVSTKRGGHVAWIQKDMKTWAPGVLTEYINAHM